MALTVPDIQAITNGSNGFDFQTVWDQQDFNALATSDLVGVYSGCAVVPLATPGYSASVDPGWVVFNGSPPISVAGGSVAVAAADATDRRDIIVANSAGGIGIVKGTDCGTAGWVRTTNALPPVKPSFGASVMLNEIAVPGGSASVTAMNASCMIDKRVMVLPALIARTAYAPSSATTYSPIAIATGLTALDSTNLAVTFAGPPSGNVRVHLGAYANSTTANKELYFGVVSTTGSPGTIAGISGRVFGTTSVVTDTPGWRVTMDQVIAVTAGTSYTWYFAAATTTAAEPTLIVQGGTTNTTVATGAPAVIEIWAA